MKKCFIFLVFAFLSCKLFAQPTLEQVAETLSQNKITRGTFTLERYSAKTKRALNSNGNFTIAAEHGMIWFTENPVKTTQVVTKNFMITENARGNRTKVEGSENKIYLQMATLTSALFCNNLNAAEQAAAIKFSAQNENWQVELSPNDASIKKMLSKIIVGGEYKNNSCVATSMQMVFTSGDTTTYQLSNHQFFDKLTDNEKSFF